MGKIVIFALALILVLSSCKFVWEYCDDDEINYSNRLMRRYMGEDKEVILQKIEMEDEVIKRGEYINVKITGLVSKGSLISPILDVKVMDGNQVIIPIKRRICDILEDENNSCPLKEGSENKFVFRYHVPNGIPKAYVNKLLKVVVNLSDMTTHLICVKFNVKISE